MALNLEEDELLLDEEEELDDDEDDDELEDDDDELLELEELLKDGVQLMWKSLTIIIESII